jgi:hypothetical protein
VTCSKAICSDCVVLDASHRDHELVKLQ